MAHSCSACGLQLRAIPVPFWGVPTSLSVEPDEKFAFEWDAKGFEEDLFLEVDPEEVHNTVEGEDNVSEILSGLFTCCVDWCTSCFSSELE